MILEGAVCARLSAAAVPQDVPQQGVDVAEEILRPRGWGPPACTTRLL